MATEIEQDAALILSFLANYPRNEFAAATKIAQVLRLPPDRVNDATALLVNSGLVEWLQVMGSAPFDFGDAMITTRGRLQVQRSADKLASTGGTGASDLQLFICHSAEDQELARRLVDLVSRALALPAPAIRCTSVDGHRLPAGANTSEQLRREVHDAKAFIGIVSHNSLSSTYVLFELGARWGAGKNLIPLIAHGVPPSVLTGPLADLNALRADSSAQLHQLIQDLGHHLSIAPQSPAAFDRALRDVVSCPAQSGSSVAPARSSGAELTEEAARVLVALAAHDGGFAEDLAHALGMSPLRAQVALDDLKTKDFIGARQAIGRPSEWYVKAGGRRYLVDHGLA